MSDIQKVLTDSDLTRYEVDGLELYFTTNRKVRATYRAIARMCEASPSSVGEILKGDQSFNVTLAKLTTGGGLQGVHLYDSVAIVACLAKLNPKRLAQFTEMGINDGLAALAGVPLPQPTATQTTEDFLRLAAKALLNMAAIGDHGSSNPGFKREIDSILERDGKALTGSLSIREMADLRGLSFTKGQSQAIGRLMADSYKARKELPEAPKVRVRYKQPNGNHQSVLLGSYPIDMLSIFDSACNAFGLA